MSLRDEASATPDTVIGPSQTLSLSKLPQAATTNRHTSFRIKAPHILTMTQTVSQNAPLSSTLSSH